MAEPTDTIYRPQRESHSTTLPIRHCSYHCRVWPGVDQSKPPILLLHGWMDTSASFQFLADALAQGSLATRTLIAPDWRGFGASSVNNGLGSDHYAYVDYLGDLDFLLNHLSPSQPVDLISHSMGGNIAMYYAGLRPTRIRSVVNLEGFGLPQTTPQEAPARLVRWLDELQQLQLGNIRMQPYASLADVARRLQKNNPRLPSDKALWLAQHLARPVDSPNGKRSWTIAADAAHKLVSPHLYQVEEARAIHSRISAPVLSVFAQDSEMDEFWQGRYTRSQYIERMHAVADIRHIELADCGHMLHHDQPYALAKAIEEFYHSPPLVQTTQ